jgi:hypothetical protein
VNFIEADVIVRRSKLYRKKARPYYFPAKKTGPWIDPTIEGELRQVCLKTRLISLNGFPERRHIPFLFSAGKGAGTESFSKSFDR